LDPYVIVRVCGQICDSFRSLGDNDDIDGCTSLKLIVESILIERETSRIVPCRANVDDMMLAEVSINDGSWWLRIGDGCGASARCGMGD